MYFVWRRFANNITYFLFILSLADTETMIGNKVHIIAFF